MILSLSFTHMSLGLTQAAGALRHTNDQKFFTVSTSYFTNKTERQLYSFPPQVLKAACYDTYEII